MALISDGREGSFSPCFFDVLGVHVVLVPSGFFLSLPLFWDWPKSEAELDLSIMKVLSWWHSLVFRWCEADL